MGRFGKKGQVDECIGALLAENVRYLGIGLGQGQIHFEKLGFAREKIGLADINREHFEIPPIILQSLDHFSAEETMSTRDTDDPMARVKRRPNSH